MFETALRYSRPVRVFDGEGSLESLNRATPATLWCDPMVQGDSLTLTCDADEDIRVGDLVEVPHNLTMLAARTPEPEEE